MNSSSGTDPYGLFPKLCPYGGNYSVKLGNDGTGAQAEGMSYTFTVPVVADTFTFTYYYAVVLQNPSHADYDQPRFFVSAYDVVTGAPITCASYNYVSTAGLPGFQQSAGRADVLYKTWSPVSIQFSGLAGRQVRLEFKTADCTLNGHFGYAYFDVGTGCSNILATAPYCANTNSVVLNAPYGFQSYTWLAADKTTVMGNQQAVTVTPPPSVNDVFYVAMDPYPGFGCHDTAKAIVVPYPVPDTPKATKEYDYCQYDFATPLQATAWADHELLWYTTPTGGTPGTTVPVPNTWTKGIQEFYVSQKKLFGCESDRVKVIVDITPLPVPGFTINQSRQCEGVNEFVFSSTSSNLDSTQYNWTFGDGQNAIAGPTDTSHKYKGYGPFPVKLTVINLPGCMRELTQVVTVVAKPVASFIVPPVICEKQTPVTFVDKTTVPNNMSTVAGWWWSINGTASTGQTPATFTPNNPGPLPVKLVATSAEGCISDTSTQIINVHYRPTAAFKYTPPLCDNELMQFENTSTMPQQSQPEFIARWFWQFDNTGSSASQNPILGFTAGQHHAVLVAESNYGCRSISADSVFLTNAKPRIGLDINDSCVYRNINYTALDVSGTVSKWFWNFGSGLKEGSDKVSKRFYVEGNNSFTLIGLSPEGCKDTINRAFTIYDNKAFAGRDTTVAMNQPVQLNAHGGPNVTYKWSPSTGLNNPNIENPVATWDKNQLYTLDAISDKGCDAHGTIFITRYKGPDIYIPTAFTPNTDGHNDVLRVLPIGIKSFTIMQVFNRYGQLIYQTSDISQGWDGRYSGQPQEPGAYVVVAKATDYKGQVMVKKQNVMLIR
ncbi:MAG: gliding motility-associated C-terminal domain-containing protein [Bacteroidetes bacterium]|nr:gliding motility-associated C-terminal domain-containing protein [Bacteroidota bacterium]